jgi:mannose-6-phosphate isomerase-like protein (cupin superfamily)
MGRFDIARRAFFERGAAMFAAVSASSLGLLAGGCNGTDDGAGQRNDSGAQARSVTGRSWRGAVLHPDDGQLLISGRRRAPMRIKIDSATAIGATMSMLISEVAPGASIPVHLHRNEDELIFIHTGSGILTLGDERMSASAGSVLYAPKSVWHGVENTGSDVITWCATYSPPGLEQYFKEVGVPPGRESAALPSDEVMRRALKYGMVFRDPI